jgi:hypothetical protein
VATHPHFKGEVTPWRKGVIHGSYWTSIDIGYLMFADGEVYKYRDTGIIAWLNLHDAGDPRGSDRGTYFNKNLRAAWTNFEKSDFEIPTMPTPNVSW